MISLRLFSTSCAVLALAGSAIAAPITFDASTSTTGFTVSNSDLLNGIVPSVNNPALVQAEESVSTNDVAALSNGAFGTPDLSAANAGEVVAIHNGAVLTFSLDTSANLLGYDITSISSYTGWRDAGRDNQNYIVSYSTVANPGSFIPLSGVNFNPSGIPAPADTAVTISDTPLATGVKALQFSFPTTENGFVGYREIDATGSPTVPEPTAAALIGLAALPLLRRRRAAR